MAECVSVVSNSPSCDNLSLKPRKAMEEAGRYCAPQNRDHTLNSSVRMRRPGKPKPRLPELLIPRDTSGTEGGVSGLLWL